MGEYVTQTKGKIEMTPEDALKLLDQAVAQMNASRQVHVSLQQAVECLRVAISKPDVEEQMEAATDGAK